MQFPRHQGKEAGEDPSPWPFPACWHVPIPCPLSLCLASGVSPRKSQPSQKLGSRGEPGPSKAGPSAAGGHASCTPLPQPISLGGLPSCSTAWLSQLPPTVGEGAVAGRGRGISLSRCPLSSELLCQHGGRIPVALESLAHRAVLPKAEKPHQPCPLLRKQSAREWLLLLLA